MVKLVDLDLTDPHLQLEITPPADLDYDLQTSVQIRISDEETNPLEPLQSTYRIFLNILANKEVEKNETNEQIDANSNKTEGSSSTSSVGISVTDKDENTTSSEQLSNTTFNGTRTAWIP